MKVFGIYRERSHSPERELDDAAILEQTASRLSDALGCQVPLLEPDLFLEAGPEGIKGADLIFYMCEERPCLDLLRQAEDAGTILVNPLAGVENTFRHEMAAVLSRFSFFPESTILSTENGSRARWREKGLWLKRGDYHAIDAEKDVVLVRDESAFLKALESFRLRGIGTVMAQDHVPGDIVKFYAVMDSVSGRVMWFHWFYHKDQDLKAYPFSQAELRQCCIAAGNEMGLEIYGGDAIVDERGMIFIIDVNAWPSFALFRQEASAHIAALLERKLDQAAGRGRA